jgi:hypothetical protein
LLTVTVTGDEVALLPDVSVAIAVSVWLPLIAVVVSQNSVYGEAVTGEPRFDPSSLNCTLATATLSAAAAVTWTVFDTVAPPAGAVIDAVGAVVSGDNVAAIAAGEDCCDTFPAASYAATV